MLSQRGQSEAPFELLISVIVMGFVILLGVYAMGFLQKEQCKAQIKDSASKLKTVIQGVVAGNTKSMVFDPPECFTKPKNSEEMQFVVRKDTLQCSRLCGGSYDQCFVFIYRSSEYNYELCFEAISPQTTFYEDTPCEDIDATKFKALDLVSNGIPRGSFEFVNKTSSVDAFPRLCAFYRISGGTAAGGG